MCLLFIWNSIAFRFRVLIHRRSQPCRSAHHHISGTFFRSYVPLRRKSKRHLSIRYRQHNTGDSCNIIISGKNKIPRLPRPLQPMSNSNSGKLRNHISRLSLLAMAMILHLPRSFHLILRTQALSESNMRWLLHVRRYIPTVFHQPLPMTVLQSLHPEIYFPEL